MEEFKEFVIMAVTLIQ